MHFQCSLPWLEVITIVDMFFENGKVGKGWFYQFIDIFILGRFKLKWHFKSRLNIFQLRYPSIDVRTIEGSTNLLVFKLFGKFQAGASLQRRLGRGRYQEEKPFTSIDCTVKIRIIIAIATACWVYLIYFVNNRIGNIDWPLSHSINTSAEKMSLEVRLIQTYL